MNKMLEISDIDITGNEDCVNYIPIKFNIFDDISKIYANVIPTFDANLPNFTFYYDLATYNEDDRLISTECVKQNF